MKKTRRNHNAALKARIAREDLRGVKTVAEIAQDNELHPVQVSTWKKEAGDNLHLLFDRKNGRDEQAERMEKRCLKAEQKLGQIMAEQDSSLPA